MNKSIEKMVLKLTEKGLKIATMESCSGGGLANEITNVSGASQVFQFSAVTYSNDFKIKMGVSSEIIDKYSVYSMQVAREMSKNISKFACSDFGIGITGKLLRADHANDAGEDDEVFYAIYDARSDKITDGKLKVQFDDREKNKQQVISAVTEDVIELL